MFRLADCLHVFARRIKLARICEIKLFELLTCIELFWIFSANDAREKCVSDRLRVQPGDMFHDPLPNGTDTVLLSNVLHDWDVPECRALIRRCADALLPGGRLLIGDVRHTGRYAQVLRQSGLEDVRRSPASVPSLLIAAMTLGFAYPANVRARKPAAAA